ncbi:hypothetical protein ACVWXO_000670 [Bradyrhizobium sp. LM2.7]
MFELQTFALFLTAATVVAFTPGPGIFYIVARTLAGGRTEGLASSVGLGLGGFVHVLAGAIGISALVMASAEAFTALKIAGALYLIWLGIKDLEGSASPRAGRSPDDRRWPCTARRHRRGGAESKDGRVLPCLYSAVRRHERERGSAVRCARHDFRRLEHWRRPDRDPLGGQSEGSTRRTTDVYRADETDLWSRDVRTRGRASYRASRKLG